MYVFALFLYLVHSFTSNILLHLFRQSLGNGWLNDGSKVKGFISISQAQEMDHYDSRISYVISMTVMYSLVIVI